MRGKAIAAIFMIMAGADALGAETGTFTSVTSSGRTVTVTVINDNIIKVTNSAAGEKAAPSASAILVPAQFAGSHSKSGHVEVITTPTGVVTTVDTSTGAVTITAGPDRSISDNGVRSTDADGRRTMTLSTMGAGSFYGAGERGYSFNLAGDTLTMYNKQNYGYTAGEKRISQMNITMPLFVSSNGYAVLFDDYAAAEMILSNPIVYTTESTDPVSYYFINGAGTLEGVTRAYTELTGRQKLPPLWSLGYITSKYGYHNERETRGVIDTLHRRDYPVDGVVLDLYWYGKEQDMGRLAWDPDQWPAHRRMLSDLKKKGVNTVLISQPYILRNGRGLANYNMLSDSGMLVKDSTGGAQEVKIWVGEGGMFDVSNPATRRWLSDRYRQLTDEGVGGWWGDLGEPEVHPETGLHANGKSARLYHNQYGNDWSSIIYDLYNETYPDRRLMTLMRGGTAGLQRYSVFPWSTDVSRSWGGLQPQVIIMLNSGLSGLGYMSHDVGGFAIDQDNPIDPELYMRWLQLGLFSPVLRTHSQFNAEPYHYPEMESTLREYIKDRYRWLPYNYTLAYENASQGRPLVRPLNYYTGGAAYDDITDEYLWGRDILVAPVLTQGATSRSVVFPADGSRWIDISDPTKVYNPGDTATVEAPLEKIPLFVREGAFIPMADYTMKNTGDYSPSRYTVNYYPASGVTGRFEMYEDNLTSNRSLEDDEYAIITFSGTDSSIDVTSRGSYPGAPEVKTLDFRIHNVAAQPEAVKVDGKTLARNKWSYDAGSRTLSASVKWTSAKPLNLTF